MKKFSLLLLFATLLLVLTSCSSGGNDVSRAYDEALNAMKHGNYAQAMEKLEGISFYEDSVQLALYCRAHARAAEEDYDSAVNELQKLGDYRDALQCAAYFSARQVEKTANNPFSRAYAASLYDGAPLSGFRDSADRAEKIRQALYSEGESAEKAEQWEEANHNFSSLEGYRDSSVRAAYTYGRSMELRADDKGLSIAAAAGAFANAGEYQDASERKMLCLNGAYEKADIFIADEQFDDAETIYQTLADLCDPMKKESLQEARKAAAEKDRLKKVSEADQLLTEDRYDEAVQIYLEAEEPVKAKEALYLKAAYLVENEEQEKGAAQYLELGQYKDSRDRHYIVGQSIKKTDPETASRIFLADREYPGAEDDLYEIALAASENKDYELSISIFREFQGERDCALRMNNDLYLYGRQLLEEENPTLAASVFDRLTGVGSADLYANMARYAAAEKLEEGGKYKAAAEAFRTISGYADSADREKSCRYSNALKLKEEKDYANAIAEFSDLSGYRDADDKYEECCYLQAEAYQNGKQWKAAISLYQDLGDYKESIAKTAECFRGLGQDQLDGGKPEDAFESFSAAADSEGMAMAAFAAGESEVTAMSLDKALKWYILASRLPETEERTAMIARSLLNMEEDEKAEQFASVVEKSEKSQAVLYELALRSLERKDEEAAMRQMRKAGDNADAMERFQDMLNARVETLVNDGKYDDAVYLCSVYGDQERADEILKIKAQKEEEERERAKKVEEAAHQAKIEEANNLLLEEKYDEAIALFAEIGEKELAASAAAKKEEIEAAKRAAEEVARLEAEKAEEAARLDAERVERERIQEQEKQAAAFLEEGDYDSSARIYGELDEPEMVKEVIYQKAIRTAQPDLFLQIMDYKDSREQHYLAGKSLLPSDPEGAFRILSDDISYMDVQAVLYDLAEEESNKGNYLLSQDIFLKLSKLPLDPEEMRADCFMRYQQDLYQYGMQMLEQREWEKASEAFGKIQEVGKAGNHYLEANYEIAAGMENSGKHSQAALAFDKLGDYSDSAARAARNRYSAADILLRGGYLENAKKAFEELGDYSDASDKVKECSYEMAEKLLAKGRFEEARDAFNELGSYSDAKEKRRESIYRIALREKNKGDYAKAINAFEMIPGYQDANGLMKECHAAVAELLLLKAEESLKSGNTTSAINDYLSAYQEYKETEQTEEMENLALVIADCYISSKDLEKAVDWYKLAGNTGTQRNWNLAEYAVTTEQYDLAEKLALEIGTEEGKKIYYNLGLKMKDAGNEDEAIRFFEKAGDVMDAKYQYEMILYNRAKKLLENGNYEEAIKVFESLNGFKDSVVQITEAHYLQGKEFLANGEYKKAFEILKSITGYKDVDILLTDDEILRIIAKTEEYTVGNYVTFGTYPQTASGEDKTPIEWLVLDRDGDKALLISRYGLDVQPYHNKHLSSITWARCTLRNWLNNTFLNKAFSKQEQSIIMMTEVDNSRNQSYKWGDYGGIITKDKIFLLSSNEANHYFDATSAGFLNTRPRVAPTAYALQAGASIINGVQTEDGLEACWWWLRSARNIQNYVDCVGQGGSIVSNKSNYTGCVRPALWINLE